MIIGSGLLAKTFINSENDFSSLIVFASGVSDSKQEKKSEFQREKDLLLRQVNKGKTIVYFSTLSIHDTKSLPSPYIQHKLDLENLIVNTFDNFIILRLPNLIGKGGNRNNFFNLIATKIKNDQVLQLYSDTSRYFLDVNLVPEIVNQIAVHKKNVIIDVCPNKNYSIEEVVHSMAEILEKKVRFKYVRVGSSYNISNLALKRLISDSLLIKINTSIHDLLEKYLD